MEFFESFEKAAQRPKKLSSSPFFSFKLSRILEFESFFLALMFNEWQKKKNLWSIYEVESLTHYHVYPQIKMLFNVTKNRRKSKKKPIKW